MRVLKRPWAYKVEVDDEGGEAFTRIIRAFSETKDMQLVNKTVEAAFALGWRFPEEPTTKKVIWPRSQQGFTHRQPGLPRRARGNRRPALIYDEEWERDFGDDRGGPDAEGNGALGWDPEEGVSDTPGRAEEELRVQSDFSLFDIAGCKESKRSRKAKTGLGDFEVLRAVPKVHPVSEGEASELYEEENDGWEKVDISGVKRTYSEVLRNIEEKDLPQCDG
ncbi:hypothetical protein HYDPIDRAFT_167672 [Hydnomerulius pinastri MD-312]|uniref:Uncharacterized protein n=1 Tax=Hydnomerulius pinastri MD-312 TaxID=994086 RepID=A0A0C9VH11_9AGAM|nr:hypothetical protein HYDPIDRAFT_167672 [Hydnomerulius pinastri MD-312]